MPSLPSRLLFLPGALGSPDFWKPLAWELSNPAECVFVTYPGFAGEPAEPSVSCFEDLVQSVASRIDRPAALIAQSMGGVVAIEVSLLKNDLVTHLVLVATSGGLDTSKLGAVEWRQTFKRDHPELPDWFTSYNSDLTSKLGRIGARVLLIWGDSDPLSPIGIGQTLLTRFRNAELHVVRGGEHDVARAHAKSIAPLIRAHLENR